MRRSLSFSCHKIAEGVALGPSLISQDDMCYYLVEPETGVVIEKGHALQGKAIGGKVLIFPSGKGSSVVQADGIYQLNMYGNAPKAMIIQHPDTVLVASCIIMGIPLVDRVEEGFYKNVENGDFIEVNADEGIVTVVKNLGE